jgi:hypothetical protein
MKESLTLMGYPKSASTQQSTMTIALLLLLGMGQRTITPSQSIKDFTSKDELRTTSLVGNGRLELDERTLGTKGLFRYPFQPVE